MSDTFVDEYPDVRVWRFRCIVDAGGALLRCRPSAIPDAVLLADPFDDWVRTRVWECVTTRRELCAVPMFAYAATVSDPNRIPRRNMTAVDWRDFPESDRREDFVACARAVAREIRGDHGQIGPSPSSRYDQEGANGSGHLARLA
jgi:hypothetical protein